MDNFTFYDLETTGTAKHYDQILQFAAVRATADLVIENIDQIDIRCRAMPHLVPTPDALLVTGTRTHSLLSADMSHYELVRTVAGHIDAWTPTTIAGFNNLAFDELFLRQAFYETLMPIYPTQMNGNTRMDILRLSHATAIYAPEAIKIPCRDGKTSFRLGGLVEANGLKLTQAHDALHDVLATLDMARVIRDRAPDVWAAMTQRTTKSQVMAFIEANPIFCWSTYYGGKPFTEIVMQICRHPADANCIAILNLADDPSAHLDKTPEQILKLMTCSPKKIRTVRTNGQPILMPLQACPANMVGRLASAVYDARAQMVGAHAGFRAGVALAMALQFPARPVAQYAEERIYEKFPSRRDEMLCRQFHQAPWNQRFGISQRLEDDRLREFAVRLIFVERPEDLPADARAKMAVWQLDRIGTDAAVPWLTSKAAIERIAALRVDAGPETLSHLAEIASYIGSLRAVDIAPPTLS